MTNREANGPLNVPNFIDKVKSDKLNDFIIMIAEETEPHSLLNVCKYILEHKEEWQEVISDIQPFLSQYDLAYEDSKNLNVEGENFVIHAIWYDIDSSDIEEYNLSVFGARGGFFEWQIKENQARIREVINNVKNKW